MHALWREAADAARTLRRSPAFSLLAVVPLGLGIAANVAVFSIVNGLLLRPLPVEDPGALVSVYERRRDEPWRNLSYPDYAYFRDHNRVFSGTAAFTVPGVQVSLRTSRDGARAVPASLVTAGYFGVLGVRPALGRFFTAEDDAPASGTTPPLVIGERLWRARFGGDPRVLGREVAVNGHPFAVVGVAPERFTGTFTGIGTDLWIPLALQPAVLPGADALDRRESQFLNAVGRLRPGVDRRRAEADLGLLAAQLERAYPETNRGKGVTLTGTTGVPPFVRRFVTPFLALLSGVAGLVLLVACANLAGLLLARATARGREMAIRSSLGATRGRLAAQLLAETLLLGLAAGAVGVAAGRALTTLFVRMLPPIGLPLALDLGVDARVAVYAVGVSLLAGALAGAAPALRVRPLELMAALRGDPAGAGRPGRLRAALLAGQIALSVLLLVATGLLVRGLRRAASVEVGFDADRVALVTTDPALLGYGAARAEAVSAELLRRARALPGVEHAALVRFTLLGPAGDEVPAVFAAGAAADSARVAYNVVSPGYLAALGIPLLAGRDLAARDDAGAPGAAVVGEAMARRFWPGRDPLGRRFSVRGAEFEVVGVARDAKYRGLGERALPYVYFSLAQEERLRLPPTALVLHARAAGDPAALLAPLRREVWAVDPDLPAEADLMRRTIRFSLFPARLAGRLVGACGVLALVLASVGLYGIAAYGAARRTREFGIRMALGARGRDVVLLVLRQGLAVTAAGLALGLLAAFWVSGLLRGLLYGVPPGDPATYAGVAALLAAVVLLAGWGPARRAARVDPAVALRVE